jgi:hypothetical protein
MPDQDQNARYNDAVTNLRDTTKWILSSFAALAALLIGTAPLNGVSGLTLWSSRWWEALGAASFSLALTAIVIMLAVRVMASSSGIGLTELANGPRFAQHRRDIIQQRMIVFPETVHELEDLEREHNQTERQAEAHPDDEQIIADALQYRALVTLCMSIAKWLEVSYRFRTLLRFLVVSLIPIMFSIFLFVTLASPAKEKPAASAPMQLTFTLAPKLTLKLPPTSPASNPPPATPTLHTNLDCGENGRLLAVGPFVSGSYLKLEPGAVDAEAAVKSLQQHLFKRTLIAVWLIGSADKTPLKSELAQQFDSNAGLAQARAERVRELMLESGEWKDLQLDDPLKVVTFAAGPTQVGLKVPADNLSLDRRVRVCALWADEN